MIGGYPNSIFSRYHKIAVEFLAEIIYTGIIFSSYAIEGRSPKIGGRA